MNTFVSRKSVALAGLIALAAACGDVSAPAGKSVAVEAGGALPAARTDVVDVLAGLPMPEDAEALFSAQMRAGDTSARFLSGIFVSRLLPDDLAEYFRLELARAGWTTESVDARNGVFLVRHDDGRRIELMIDHRQDGGYGSAFTVTVLNGGPAALPGVDAAQ